MNAPSKEERLRRAEQHWRQAIEFALEGKVHAARIDADDATHQLINAAYLYEVELGTPRSERG